MEAATEGLPPPDTTMAPADEEVVRLRARVWALEDENDILAVAATREAELAKNVTR